MDNTINGKTPEEIKKGMEHCAAEGSSCKDCAFCADCDVDIYAIERYGLALIEQLERERDAAVEAAHGVCKACIHFNGHYPPGDIMSCCKFEECLYGMDEWEAEDHWQWRGVQEVE